MTRQARAAQGNAADEKAGFSGKVGTALSFAAPQLIILLLFFYWPVVEALWWSVNLQSPFGGEGRFVGLEVFQRLLDDPEYLRSLRITLVFVALTTSIALGLGLLFASVADDTLRGSRFYRTGIIWPYAVAAPVAATAFQFIFDPAAGLMTYANQFWPGIWNPYLSGSNAFLMIVLVSAWQNIAYNFIFLLAGLRSIPTSIYEAAAIDGATPFTQFTTITLPLLTPTLFLLTVLNIADNFTGSFGVVNVMTQGGPGGATNLLVYKIYADGFIGLNLSMSSAQSVLLMVLMVTITFVQFRFVEKRVNYTM